VSADDMQDGALHKVANVLDHVPAPLRNMAAQLISSPLIGMVAGFLLLFGGIFLAVAWTVAPQPLIDAHRYAPFTASTSGKVVDAWTALAFDPLDLPKDRLRWFGFAKIASCEIVEYGKDWNAPIRRAFCGNRFTFRNDMRMDDWNTLAPGVPFVFARDEKGFDIEQMRMSPAAMEWFESHPPDDTFMLSKPPPTTAYGELLEQFDLPLDVAMASWSRAVPAFPLAFDPAHPDQAMPAKYVDDRRDGPWLGAYVFTILFGLIGLFVWRIGMAFLFGGQSPIVFWALTLAPLLALPWWTDALPTMLRHVNRDWAEIASDMLDDITRVTRLNASDPADASFADGARVEWHADRGHYADTFGQVPFHAPQPLPQNAKAARTALIDQTSKYVATLDSASKSALFDRLRQMNDADLRNVQSIFFTSAEETLRDGKSNAAAHAAAKRFLLFASGGGYYEDRLNATEVPPANTP
jgi:hypothetical protein